MCSCRGQPEAGDQTIAAFLRRIRAEDGAPLPELRFWSELSIFFFAGDSFRPPVQDDIRAHPFSLCSKLDDPHCWANETGRILTNSALESLACI